MTKTIRQKVSLAATPHAVFEALLDSKKHTAFTGDKATISRKIGGRVSTFGGWATGVNVALQRDRLIRQTWRSAEFKEAEPDSSVTFILSQKGTRTELRFVQSGVPDRLAADLRQGWEDFYWTPLKAYLAGPTE